MRRRVHHVVEEPLVLHLGQERLDAAVGVELDRHPHLHLDLVVGSGDHDGLREDHPIDVVLEADLLIGRPQDVADRVQIFGERAVPVIGPRESRRAGEREHHVRPAGSFEHVEIATLIRHGQTGEQPFPLDLDVPVRSHASSHRSRGSFA